MMKKKEEKRVPQLRFPEFTDDWEQRKLDEVVERITRKNENLESTLPLTISAQYGLIDQNEFFDKRIASKDVSGYYLIRKGEFAYNKSTSSDAPWGAIKRLDRYENGVLSTLYIVFKILDEYKTSSDYLATYYSTELWHKGVQAIAAEGARNHGLLNITPADFFKTDLMLPTNISEQQKIGAYFKQLDNLITLHQRKLKNLNVLKKGVMQKLFNQEVRFKADDGSEFPEWKEKMLSEVFEISTETNGDRYSKQDVLSVSDEYGVVNQIEFQGRSFAGNDISKYKVVKTGQIIYTRSPLAIKPFGIIKRVGDKTGVVSPLYIVNDVSENNCSMFWYYNFDMPERTNNYLKPLVRMGAKHTMNISNEEWLSGKVFAPCLAEQQKIANCLCTLDDTIEKQKATLAEWKELKKGLLQQMFV